MRHNAARALLGALALSLIATSCFGGGGGENIDPNQAASDVKPPSPVDTKRSGLPGLVVATNSPSMQRLANSPEGDGAVILFVEPGGPADGLGLGQGDLIYQVGGKDVRNHPRALALLHERPGTEIEMKIRHRDGEERTLTIEPREPRVASVRQYLNNLVAASPKNPVLRYLRAQTPGVLSLRLGDLDEALKEDKRFVEALTLRASLIWDFRPNDEQEEARFIEEALNGWKQALQIDPENRTTLTTRSTILSVLGSAQQARRDAAKAIELDESHPRAYYALAVAEEALKHPERAAAPARAAIDLDPFNIQHWRVLARVFDALKRKNDCVKTVNGFAPFLEEQNFSQDARTLKSLCN